MTEIKIDISRKKSTFCLDVGEGEYFTHEGDLFLRVIGGDEDEEGFEISAVSLQDGQMWNFEGWEEVELVKRLRMTAEVGGSND